jgi:hypothetical protein
MARPFPREGLCLPGFMLLTRVSLLAVSFRSTTGVGENISIAASRSFADMPSKSKDDANEPGTRMLGACLFL